MHREFQSKLQGLVHADGINAGTGLDTIIYPINPQNNVRYTYGDSTASYNRRGRIALLEDASGFRAYKYGKLGEVTEEHRTFVLPNEGYQYSFKTQFSYDSWNRVQYISYPDGEMVYYKYNVGGMLESVYGRKVVQNIIASPGGRDATDFNPTPPPSTTYTYRYIDSISYNKFELKSGQWYGNGTQAQYSYDILQRLENLKLYDNYRPRHLLQDITYTYDKASNIDTIRNAATTVSTLGGRYTYTYQYDSLYRLTGGAGNFANLKPLANYALSMTYAADGRILRKTQNGTTRLNGRAANFNTDISYTYNSRRPHTLYSAGGKAYTWNANGNLLSEGDPLIATRKYLQLAWDEGNRMLSADMPQAHTCAIYAYDADGERFYRNVGTRTEMTQNGQTYVYRQYGDPVLYPSPYVVCTPQGYTKHYFVGSERLASRLGDGTISGLNNHVANAAALAAKQAKVNAAAPDSIVPNRFAILRQLQAHWSNHHTTYWQHSDHLGSASWVTDTNGMGYQHLQYMPWGEPLVDQRVSGATYRSRYTFSDKERDEETGLSYFGARYYNSALSIWLSVDPMSDKYPGVSPYTYCANNPVRLVDEDGREIWHPDGAGNLVADKGDNAWNLADYLTNKLGKPTTPTMATNMLVEQGYSINDNGILNLKVGDIVSIASYVSGGIENVARNSNATLRFMNSKNQFDFKFYPNGWRGNQWVKPFKFSDVSKALGRFNSSLAIVGAGLDLSQINSTHSWWENAGHILDAGLGIVGTLGWPGFMIATYYFVVIKNAPEIFNYQREDSIDRANLMKKGYPAMRTGIK